MRGHQLFIPGKALSTEAQPEYGTDMRAIETAFNALPTPPGAHAGFTRVSKYQVLAKTHRTAYLAGNRFKWTTAAVKTRYRSSPLAPELIVGIGTTATTVLHVVGSVENGRRVISMTGAWIMHITLVAPVRRAAVNLYNINWSFQETTPPTVFGNLIDDTILWPATTTVPDTVHRSYTGALVAAAAGTATILFGNIDIFTGIIPGRTITLAHGSTVTVVFTFVLQQGAPTT